MLDAKNPSWRDGPAETSYIEPPAGPCHVWPGAVALGKHRDPPVRSISAAPIRAGRVPTKRETPSAWTRILAPGVSRTARPESRSIHKYPSDAAIRGASGQRHDDAIFLWISAGSVHRKWCLILILPVERLNRPAYPGAAPDVGGPGGEGVPCRAGFRLGFETVSSAIQPSSCRRWAVTRRCYPYGCARHKKVRTNPSKGSC